MGNSRKLFHLIRATGGKTLNASGIICKADGSSVQDYQRLILLRAKHFEVHFAWFSVSTAPIAILAHIEIRKEFQALKRHDAVSDGLSPAHLKKPGMKLSSYLWVLFSKIWHSEKVLSLQQSSVFKKGSRSGCVSHESISLIPVALMIGGSIRSSHSDSYLSPVLFSNSQQSLCSQTVFGSVNRFAIWHHLLSSGVPEQYVSVLKYLYHNILGGVRVHNQFSPLFAFSSRMQRGCLTLPPHFNFVVTVPPTSSSNQSDGEVELLSGIQFWIRLWRLYP